MSSDNLQQSHWSLASAVNILEQKDLELVDSLNVYLEAQKPTLLDPSKFVTKEKLAQDISKGELKSGKFVYKFEASEKLITKETLQLLCDCLNVNELEAFKVIVQFSDKKLIELSQVEQGETHHKSFLFAKNEEKSKQKPSFLNERTLLYASEILKEKRRIVKFLVLVMKNQTLHQCLSSFSDEILANYNKIMSFAMDEIKAAHKQLQPEFFVKVPGSEGEENEENAAKLTKVVQRESLLILLDLLSLLNQILIPIVVEKNFVQEWFELMDEVHYLSELHYDTLQSHLDSIKASATLSSLLFLGYNIELKAFDITLDYLNDCEIFRIVDSSILSLDYNHLLKYSWSVVNYTRIWIFEETDSKAITFLDDLDLSLQEFKYEVEKFNIFDPHLRDLVFEQIKEVYDYLSYDEIHQTILWSLISTFVPFFELSQTSCGIVSDLLIESDQEFKESFVLSDTFLKAIDSKKLKCPEDLESFDSMINLLKIDGELSVLVLEKLNTYMHFFKTGELNYRTSNEAVFLTEKAVIRPILEPSHSNNFLCFEADTKGHVVMQSDSGYNAIIFALQYDGWALIGKVLESLVYKLISEESQDSQTEQVPLSDCEKMLADILSLINSAFKTANYEIIGKLEKNCSVDFFELLFKLVSLSLVKSKPETLKIVNEMFGMLLKDYSNEVWSILIKSNYFENSNPLLIQNIFAIEKTNGEFSFSLSLLKLTDALIMNSLSSGANSNTTDSSKEEIIYRLTTYFVLFYENFFSWNFMKTYQKFELGKRILDLFAKIVFTLYSTNLDKKAVSPISLLKKPGSVIIQSFLNDSKVDSFASTPLLSVIEGLCEGFLLVETGDKLSLYFENFVYSLFEFNRLIISLRSMFKMKESFLEKELFNNLKNLIKVYIIYPNYKLEVLHLINTLINGYYGEAKPPSLLAHLGTKDSKILLSSLFIDLEAKLVEHDLKNLLYDFFARIIEKNQDGFSSIFLGDKENKSILNIMKRNVIDMEKYPNSVTIHLLDAMCNTFNSWATVQKIEENDEKFISSLTQYVDKHCMLSELVEKNEFESLGDVVSRTIKGCYRIKLLSSIGEILALYLFSSSNEKIIKPILTLMEKSQFLTEHAYQIFKIHNYDSSLHLNANSKFEEQFKGFKLEDFYRTTLNKSRRYGVGTVFNLSLMDQLFASNDAWNDSLRHDVVLASLNLQYISSQNSLIKSWGALISSYMRFKVSNPNKKYIELATLLLSINNEEGIPAPSFKSIYLERIELTFYILYSLQTKNAISVSDEQLSKLFETIAKSLLSEEVNFTANMAQNNVHMYRSLFRSLLITMKLCCTKAYLLEKNPGLLIDLFNKMVVSGSKIVISSAQDNVANRAEDFLMIISLFKSFVNINFSKSIMDTFTLLLDNDNTIKHIFDLYLYSNAILLDGESVFADLSLNFIIELISVESIAENLLKLGLFSVLANGPISIEIKRGGIRSDKNLRYHHIWSNGLLNIVLILLGKFGTRLIPDVVQFVKQFEKQISFTLSSWSKDSLVVTTSVINETSQLIVLHKALNKLSFREYIGVNYNKDTTQDLQIFPGLDTEKQRKSLLDSFNYLLTHPKYLQSRIVILSGDDQGGYEDEGKGRTKLVSKMIAEMHELSAALKNN